MHHLVLTIILLGSFILSAGCPSSAPESAKNEITIALSASPRTLDPRHATDANGMRLSHLLFSSLVKVGPQLEIVGDAAESWKFEDGTYHFTLRPALSFSNGQPITAEDIKFSFNQYQENSPFRSALKSIQTVQVDNQNGKLVVKIKLSPFSATFLTDLTPIKILPKTVITKHGDDFASHLIGSGSYVLSKQGAQEIVLTARKDHPYAAPKNEALRFKIIQDAGTRYLKTLKGGVDVVQSDMPAAKIKHFEKSDDFHVYKAPGVSMTYLLLNLKDKDIAKKPLRLALAQAIHRSQIIKYKLEGLAQPADSLLSPANPFYNKELKGFSFNPQQAEQMIKKMGLNDKKFSLKTSNSQEAIENGKVIAQQLRDAGLKIELQSYEWGTFYGDIKKGRYQLATMRWVGITDPDIYRIAFHSKEQPTSEYAGRNRGFYTNKQLDKLVEEGLQIDSLEKRIAHYKAVQKIVLDDLPIIPLWYDQQVAIVHKDIKDYELPMNGDFSALIQAHK